MSGKAIVLDENILIRAFFRKKSSRWGMVIDEDYLQSVRID